MNVQWPDTLKPQNVLFDQAVPSQSGGRGISGNEQVVVSDSGYWVATLKFSTFRQSQGTTRRANLQVAWRAMKAILEGRSNAFLIGPYERGSSPAAMAGEDYGPFSLPHDDDALFDDGAGYDQYSSPAHVRDNAAAGATSIIVTMEAGHSPEPGQYFGNADRLYLIKSAELIGGNAWALTFWPKLRAAAVANSAVNFDDPVCLMRLSKDGAAQMAVAARAGVNPSLDIVEAPVEP